MVSDSDSAFLGGKDSTDKRNFQKVLDDNYCMHDTVPIWDHKALGIIDRWARTLKFVLTKLLF